MASWEGVTEFVAVAETESFTAAAKRLNSSVANISRQIQTLENRLANKLLHRTTRKVSATEEDRDFYHHCRQLRTNGVRALLMSGPSDPDIIRALTPTCSDPDMLLTPTC